MKKCRDCLLDKNLEEFYRHPGNLDGRMGHCKLCHMIRCKKRNDKNKKSKRDYDKLYRIRRSVLLRENHAQYQREIYSADIQAKLKIILRSRLIGALKKNQKSGSAIRDLGCSIDELKRYLESKFQPGMTWDNWSRTGWHIDHIVPLAKFDLTNYEELKIACHYTNLQPLWAKDNIKKANKIL